MDLLFRLSLACIVIGSILAKGPDKSPAKQNVQTEDFFDDLPVAVTVARTDSFGDYEALAFPDLVVNIGNRWSKQQNTVTFRENTTVFIQLSAGLEPGQPVNLDVEGSQYNADVLRKDTSHNGFDTLGTNFISSVSDGDNLFVQNNPGSFVYSEGGRQASLTVFDLKNYLFDGNAIFSAGTIEIVAVTGTVPLDRIFVNQGDSFAENTFTAAQSGYHFLTASVGLLAGVSTKASLQSSGVTLGAMHRTSTNSDFVDTMSMSLIVELIRGDQVTLNIDEGSLYSDGDNQIAFGGFQCFTRDGNEIAWSVYTTESFQLDDNSTTPLDPLPFAGETVNSGLFDPTDNQVKITESGLYYVQLNAATIPSTPLDVSLVRYRQRVEMSIYRSSVSHNGVDTLSRGMLLRLSAGDTLRVVLGPGAGAYGSPTDQLTRFSGFLLSTLQAP